MKTHKLPNELKVGDKIACLKSSGTNEIIEVVKVRDTGHLLLMRENGNAIPSQYTIDDLSRFGYELVEAI